jgi:PhzF family phenazine biosynthesis protein
MTTALPFFQVDAFASGPFTGNPAAVMPLDHWLDDKVMQAIAAENNLSETAFTVPSEGDDADYDLRWFTPAVEVPLCGHATLAAAHILLKGAAVRFATKSGILSVTRDPDDAALLKLDLPAAPLHEVSEPEVCEALGISPRPLWLAEGCNDSIIVPLEDEGEVLATSPDFAALGRIHRMAIVTAPGDSQDIVSRVFVPYAGIDEDPVTGSAHAALVPYWAKRLGRTRFTALQASARTGLLDCELRDERVILGGHAVTLIEGYFQI